MNGAKIRPFEMFFLPRSLLTSAFLLSLRDRSASKADGYRISRTVFYSPCPGFAQSRRFQYFTAQDEVLQSGVQMPQWVPLQ